MLDTKKTGFTLDNIYIFAALVAVIYTTFQYIFKEAMTLGDIVFSLVFLFVIIVILDWFNIKFRKKLEERRVERKSHIGN